MGMSESTRAGGKSQAQQTSLASGDEVSKMMAASSPLTLETLIIELEKFQEKTDCGTHRLSPIDSSLESVTTTVPKHTSTISEMEMALSTHSDNITSLEQEVVELRSKLASITEEHGTLQTTV